MGSASENYKNIMHISDEQKARIKRVAVNGLIVMISAMFTAGAEYISHIDFGSWSPLVIASVAMVAKSVQAWTHEAQDEYMPK